MNSSCLIAILVAAAVVLCLARASGCGESVVTELASVNERTTCSIPKHQDKKAKISLLFNNSLGKILGEEVNERLELLGTVSDSTVHLERTFMGPAHRRAASMIREWMKDAGMVAWVDSVGNVRGRTPDSTAKSKGKAKEPALLIGSHYDTVIDGGKFDGALGIVVAIAAVKALILEQGENLTKPVEVVAFSDEEGVRFQSTFLGSRALCGTLLSDEEAMNVRDKTGMTIVDALKDAGLIENWGNISGAAADAGAFGGYLEVHIEQGPVLEDAGIPLGVVSGIAGQSWLAISVNGEQGHAGTVPMGLRKDPMAGAASIISGIEALCRRKASHEDGSLVCTVGSLQMWPGASNVIPSTVNFTVDVRSLSDAVRDHVVDSIHMLTDSACQERRLTCSLSLNHWARAISSDSKLTSMLSDSIPQVHGVDTCPLAMQPLSLASGAGHDAIAIAGIAPISMLFVRCKEGMSHTPREWADPKDVGLSAAVILEFLKKWQRS